VGRANAEHSDKPANPRRSTVRPNPCIEKTSPGKPGTNSHVKRQFLPLWSRVRNKLIGVLARCLLLAAPCAASLTAWATPMEQTIGGIDAMIAACGPVDPKSTKTGIEMLERLRTQNKLDLDAVRRSDDYKAIYNPELNRLLALQPKARVQTCQSVF
jgi:hypothetical protein